MSRSPRRPPRAPWKLHEAKARFSELFRAVLDEGPQRVTKQGGESVVIVPGDTFDRLNESAAQPARLVDFFRAAPTADKDFALERKRDATRRIDW